MARPSKSVNFAFGIVTYQLDKVIPPAQRTTGARLICRKGLHHLRLAAICQSHVELVIGVNVVQLRE